VPVPSPLHRQQVLLRGQELLRGREPVQALLPQVQVPQQREVEFLWHDKLKGAADANAKRKELAAEYAATLASAQSAAEKGGVDAVIAPADTRVTLLSALDILSGKRVSKLPKKHNNIPF